MNNMFKIIMSVVMFLISSPTVEPIVNVEMLSAYEQLYESNNDVFGYMYLPNNIEYPVMYTPYNQNYYIDHDVNGKSSKEGLPFLNKDSVLGESGISLIYGHHLKSGRGFTVLKNFLKENYVSSHNTIQVDTLFKNQTYQVVGVALTSLDESFNYYDYIGSINETEFEEWKQGFSKYLKWGSLSELKYDDIILELSTCYYHKKDGRLVVILKCVESY